MKKMCESCGMPLKDDVKGTKSDGSPSDKYCKYCFANDVFLHPDATPEDMMQHSVEGMSEKGWPKFLAKLMVRNTPKLPRWQQGDSTKPSEE